MKKAGFIGFSFVGTPLLILLCIFFLFYLNFEKNGQRLAANNSQIAYSALPDLQNGLKDRIIAKDARFETLTSFFKKYQSELEPFSQDFIDTADKYGIDYRLLPSIAMQESNLCKKAREGSFNCWGFGIYGNTYTTFKSYPEAIEVISKTLASEYKDKGLKNPDQIMSKYTPSSNGSWARGVNHFMAELALTSASSYLPSGL